MYTSALMCDPKLRPYRLKLGLTATERQVIGLSLHDPLITVMPTGRLRRLLHFVVGIRPVNRLADPQLEMLRAFCVRYRVEGQAAFFQLSSSASSPGLSSRSTLAAALLIDRWANPDLRRK